MISFLKTVVGVILLATAVFFGYRVYRHFRPGYVPPPPRAEVVLTIIPGWNLRQVAEYLVLKGFATSTEDVYYLTGRPAKLYSLLEMKDFDDRWWHIYPLDTGFHLTRPDLVSFEGYLAPETVRVFADAKLVDVLTKFVALRDSQIATKIETRTENNHRPLQQVLTMASIIEKETRHEEDRAKVADILWRRFKKGWALQVDSTVHYAVGRTGDVFTTDKERRVDSPWNTYKHAGLPPGPICNPSLESIKAALYPEKNDYWYFLSGRDGKMYYAKTLEEHNRNKKYL